MSTIVIDPTRTDPEPIRTEPIRPEPIRPEPIHTGPAPVRGPRRPRELRPGRGTGRGARPQARPARPVAPPRLSEPGPQAAGCRVLRPLSGAPVDWTTSPAPARAMASAWRLTDRGIALVLATGMALATAALVVVALTALRVTGDQYVPAGQVTTWQR